jgi:hypothetical protein
MIRRIGIACHVFLIAAVGCVTGCRTDPSIELLESELRWYEDHLYLLNRQLDQACVQLDSCRRYNSVLQQELADYRAETNGKPPSATPGDRNGRPSRRPERPSPADENLDLDVPEIDYGTEVPGAGDAEEPESAPPRIQQDTGSDAPADLGGKSAQYQSAEPISRIVLNPRLTGGCDFDGKPGDDGISVVIEPQDRNGRYVALPGEISVILTDRNKTGDDARLARWDYDSADAACLMKKSLFGRGVHLELPWPARPPETRELHVEVKYISPEGRRFRAGRDIFVSVERNPKPIPYQSVARTSFDSSEEANRDRSRHGRKTAGSYR